MKARESYKLIILATLLSWTFGQETGMLLTKYRGNLEGYIMKGHSGGWKNCDIVHDTSEQLNFSEDTLRFVMDLTMMGSSDIRTTFSSSHCLLVSARVSNNQSLSDIFKFGWSVIQHKRLALVLQLEAGLTLDMAANTSKLPFTVAAIDQHKKEQFLCPVIGRASPKLQDYMCNTSYVSLKEKNLRVAIFGVPPYFYGEIHCGITPRYYQE